MKQQQELICPCIHGQRSVPSFEYDAHDTHVCCIIVAAVSNEWHLARNRLALAKISYADIRLVSHLIPTPTQHRLELLLQHGIFHNQGTTT